MRNTLTLTTALALGLVWSSPSEARTKKTMKKCIGLAAASPHFGLPFSIGEELTYDLTVAGVYVGRIDMKVGKPRKVNGKKAMTLFSRARTNSFAKKFASFEGRWMSVVDPVSLRPLAVRTESTYGKDRRWEKARFPKAEAVKADYMYKGHKRVRGYDNRDAPLFDLLSVLYFARTRVLEAGVEGCQEVYADRRLWRMDGKVRGKDRISTPAGKKDVYVVDAYLERAPHRDFNPKRRRPWVKLEIFIADDEHRTPLAFTVVNSVKIKGRGDLSRWSMKGRSGDRSWEF